MRLPRPSSVGNGGSNWTTAGAAVAAAGKPNAPPAKTVAVRVPDPRAQDTVDNRGHPKMQIIDESHAVYEFPFAPEEVRHTDFAPTYTEATRPGRAPLVLRSNEPLPKISFEVFIGAQYHQTDVEGTLLALVALGQTRQRLTIVHMGGIIGAQNPWRLTGLAITSNKRQHGTNHITRATASLTFSKAMDAAKAVGPLSGGVRPVGSGGSGSTSYTPGVDRDPSTNKTRTYIVKKGDTPQKISIAMYKTDVHWQLILDYNHLSGVRDLVVGMKLNIPNLNSGTKPGGPQA